MAYVAKGDKEFEAGAASAPKSHKIRITLTSRNVKALEKGTSTHLARGVTGLDETGVGRAGEWDRELIRLFV